MNYSYHSLVEAYKNVGLKKGMCVYITGDLTILGISLEISKTELLGMHFKAIFDIITEEGTLIVPTHSFSLCNTDKPFSLEKTRSETGAFSEYVRTKAGCIRQMHPFSSRAAIGKYAEYICQNTSNHSYGQHTPFARMLELNTLFISIGIHPKQIVSLVHQCESDMNVPYRYSKEFLHPIEREGVIKVEPFYHLVTYQGAGIKRDKNTKIFEHFEKSFSLNSMTLANGMLWGFDMQSFYKATTLLMCEDIYCWLEHPPSSRPYRK